MDLTQMDADQLFEETRTRIGLAIRVHPRSRDSVLLWSKAMDCQLEWNRRGQPEEYQRAYDEEKGSRS